MPGSSLFFEVAMPDVRTLRSAGPLAIAIGSLFRGVPMTLSQAGGRSAGAPGNGDPHDWKVSTLGHGDTMCARCFITNLEAAALGEWTCLPTSSSATSSSEDPDSSKR